MTITITREIEIIVEARIIPGTPATYMQPGCAPDIEILEAHADGNIIEPLDMLTPEQRHQLDVRLQSAVAWPEPELIASAVLPLQERVKAKAKPMRRAR